MAGPKGGKPSDEGMTLREMVSVAGKLLPDPMQRAGGAIKPIFEGVSAARQTEESHAPVPETGPSQKKDVPEPAPRDGLSFNASVASFLGVSTGRRSDTENDAAVNGPPPKPPGM